MAYRGEVKAIVTTVIVSSSPWMANFLSLGAYKTLFFNLHNYHKKTYIIFIRNLPFF